VIGAFASQSALAPAASVDRNVAAGEACNRDGAGYVPVVAAFTLGEIICVQPGTFLSSV
jgi:hypothetical protein